MTFSYSVKGEVTPNGFYNRPQNVEKNQNQATSRHLSTEKHDALNVLLDVQLTKLRDYNATVESDCLVTGALSSETKLRRLAIYHRLHILKQGHFQQGMSNPHHERDACKD